MLIVVEYVPFEQSCLCNEQCNLFVVTRERIKIPVFLPEVNDTEMRRKSPIPIERALVCCIVVAVSFIPFTKQKLEAEEQQEEWLQVNLIEFADNLMPLVSRLMIENEMDPLTVSDVGQSFRIVGPLLFSPAIHAEFTYSFFSGSMNHLSKLERYGTVIVSYTGQRFTIDGNVAFDSILLTYDYFTKLLFLKQQKQLSFADPLLSSMKEVL